MQRSNRYNVPSRLAEVPRKRAQHSDKKKPCEGRGSGQVLTSKRPAECRPCTHANRLNSGALRSSKDKAELTRAVILAGYWDHHLGYRAAELPAFCPRRSEARKCRDRYQPGDRLRPWTGKADRSTWYFPLCRLRQHYCRRRADMASRAERVPAVQRVDPAALAQLGSRVPLRLRR